MRLPFRKKYGGNPPDKIKDIIADNGKFAIIEGYKIARANIIFSLAAKESKCFAISSWSKGEGKSTVSANIAISFSKLDKKVILIDADLRRPNVHNLLKIKNDKGLSQVLTKQTIFEEAVHREVLPSLDVLTVGAIPPNPSELLSTSHLKNLIDKLNEEYDYIIFDTPPIGVVADALLLKEYIAGFVIVIRERSTSHREIEKLLENTKLSEIPVIGFVRVGCKKTFSKYYKKGYYKYYQYY